MGKAVISICLFWMFQSALANVRIDLDKCENLPCKCTKDKQKMEVRLCPDLKGTETVAIVPDSLRDYTLFHAGDNVEDIPASFIGQKQAIKMVVVRNVPKLKKISNYVLYYAKVGAVKLELQAGDGGAPKIEGSAFAEWNKAHDFSGCQTSASTFSPDCRAFSLTVDRNPKDPDAAVTLELLKGTEWVSALSVGGMIAKIGNDGKWLEPYTKLTHLEVSGALLNSLTRESMNQLRKLQYLSISNRKGGKASEPSLVAWLRSKPNLETLKIEDFVIDLGGWIDSLDKPEKISKLSLRGSSFPKGLPKPFSALVNVQEIDVSNTSLSDAMVLENFKNLKQVKLPDLAGGKNRDCVCKTYEWLRDWGPYKKHGEMVLRDKDGASLPVYVDGQRKNVDACLKHCKAGSKGTGSSQTGSSETGSSKTGSTTPGSSAASLASKTFVVLSLFGIAYRL